MSINSHGVDLEDSALAGKKALKLRFGGSSRAGLKAENQDAFAAHLPTGSARFLKGGIACIADGVSCSENAQQASSTSVTLFIEDYFSTPDTWPVKMAAARVLSSLNSWLYHHGQQSNARHNGLVTTFSGVIFKSNTAHFFHAGDSRIYALRQGALQQITRDHCHQQAGRKTFLTRALGMDSRLEVDYQTEEIALGDTFLLTTDGIHEWLTEREMVDIIDAHQGQLEQAAAALSNAALANGSDDNLTCLLVTVDELPLAEIDEVHRSLTQLAIPPVLQEGQKIDHYEVQSIIHAGTRSHLYLVKDIHNNQLQVLKAPSENFKDDAQYLEGFIREQWVGRRLNHAGVMKILPRPDASPFLYHVCEYVEGITLRQWIYDNPKPDLKSVRDMLDKIVNSLRAFQRLSMIHRDLKPENIMIDKRGRPIIIDFGTVFVAGLGEISTPLMEHVPVGSVDYIAPEYLLGEPATDRSDLFSLAAIAYEMICGKLPFDIPDMQRNPPTQFEAWQYQSIRTHRKDVPVWLDLALRKALSPRPKFRYPAYSEFIHDLSQPNAQLMQKFESAPLLERNPVVFWKLLCALLFVVICSQYVWFFA
ncbi:bifunctional protein-serine/threonine kinase/phosphatase [Simiduia curdlanivorans]|uniref:Protein phosphatase 2C domain-containing protein n=1 Tax=Simiduia curdlanivorans TaxID=1492769 RepID=A0ABV8V937_9GAMM|nr:bifunctional protein-serine/threonine kinase/phosphatase [Simiduia curdlanivorans]MDN3639096.1 bifunctional protein-serine/threonine kinase/phosphatase [Simiduia curdlanivorans]